MALTAPTERHLLAHHGDFAHFAELMVKTHAGRFDPVFWAVMSMYQPAEVQRVVDFGTGPGLLLEDLAGRFPGAEIVGVDGQPEMLKKAEAIAQRHDRVRVLRADVAAPPVDLPDGCADIVTASMVLHELVVPTTMLDEARRILRPGGLLLVYDWVRQPLAAYNDGKRPEDADRFTHFSEHCRYTPEDLTFLFEQSGFVVCEWLGRKNGRFALFACVAGS